MKEVFRPAGFAKCLCNVGSSETVIPEYKTRNNFLLEAVGLPRVEITVMENLRARISVVTRGSGNNPPPPAWSRGW